MKTLLVKRNEIFMEIIYNNIARENLFTWPHYIGEKIYESPYDVSPWMFFNHKMTKFLYLSVISSYAHIYPEGISSRLYPFSFWLYLHICCLLYLNNLLTVSWILFHGWNTIKCFGLTYFLFKFWNIDPIWYLYDIYLGECFYSCLIHFNYLKSI